MILFAFFVIVPLIEIALFIIVGDEIGVLSTLFLCFVSAVAGSVLVRQQGLKALFAAKGSMEQGTMPVGELFDGLCIAIAGVMLITPGFFTDTVGFLLLVPKVRVWLRHKIASHFDLEMQATDASGFRRSDSYIIEAEYERLDDKDKP